MKDCGIFSAWQNRFLRIKDDALLVFVDATSEEPQTKIPLKRILLEGIYTPQDNRIYTEDEIFSFVIRWPEELGEFNMMHFGSNKEATVAAWFQELNRISETLKGNLIDPEIEESSSHGVLIHSTDRYRLFFAQKTQTITLRFCFDEKIPEWLRKNEIHKKLDFFGIFQFSLRFNFVNKRDGARIHRIVDKVAAENHWLEIPVKFASVRKNQFLIVFEKQNTGIFFWFYLQLVWLIPAAAEWLINEEKIK